MICPNCGEPDCDSECLLIGTGAPGRDRRVWLRAQAANVGARMTEPRQIVEGGCVNPDLKPAARTPVQAILRWLRRILRAN
jgi:hypothetical protein